MTPWEVALLIMGWTFTALVFVGACIIVFAVLVGGYRGIAMMFPNKEK